jgi:hypothetical protein
MIEEYTKRSTKTERKTTAVQNPSEDRNLTAHGGLAEGELGCILDCNDHSERV